MDSIDLRAAQRLRHASDIADGDALSPSPARLKRRALELGALSGRILSSGGVPRPDMAEAVLSTAAGAANLMRLDLGTIDFGAADADPLRIADAAGRLADAAEKIDHLEDFGALAREAIADAVRWALSAKGATASTG